MVEANCNNCSYKTDTNNGILCRKTNEYINKIDNCLDATEYEDYEYRNKAKRQRRNKRERDLKHKEHLKHLASCARNCPPVVYRETKYIQIVHKRKRPVRSWTAVWSWTEWKEVPLKKPYYERVYRGHGRRSNTRYHKLTNV